MHFVLHYELPDIAQGLECEKGLPILIHGLVFSPL